MTPTTDNLVSKMGAGQTEIAKRIQMRAFKWLRIEAEITTTQLGQEWDRALTVLGLRRSLLRMETAMKDAVMVNMEYITMAAEDQREDITSDHTLGILAYLHINMEAKPLPRGQNVIYMHFIFALFCHK